MSDYTWTLQSGTIPPGTSLDLDEIDLTTTLSGTPTTPGTYNFTVRITNDVSGEFDDQAYSVLIVEQRIEITPDLGTPIADLFADSNPKLLTVDLSDLVDVTGQPFSETYVPARKIRLRADLGSGVKTYEIPAGLTSGIRSLGRRYFWRTNSAPTVINEVIIV